MAGLFSFSNDAAGLGTIVSSIVNKNAAGKQINANKELGLISLNNQKEAQKQKLKLAGMIASGLGILALIYIVLKD